MRRRRWWMVVGLGVAVGLGGVGCAGAQGTKATANSAMLEEAERLHAQVVTLQKAAKYDDALLLAERALAIREKALGLGHPDVATSLDRLGELYLAKGEYGRAEPLCQRALAIQERALGPVHPDVATSLNDLAEIYQAAGEFERVGPLARRALEIREKALGKEHPKVATSLDTVASTYLVTNEFARAEELHTHALEIREKSLGADHPDVAISLNNLAAHHRRKGEVDRAEALYTRALAIREKALGPEHPDVAISLHSLGLLCDTRGDYDRAEALFTRALAIREKALGPDHPLVAASLSSLAQLSQASGNHARAEELYRRSIALFEKAQGTEGPVVAGALNQLAGVYWTAGRSSEAILVFSRAEAVEERSLARMAGTVSEAQTATFLAKRLALTGETITFALEARDPRAADLALTHVLRRKGRALDTMAGSVRALRAHLDPIAQKLFDQLKEARRQHVTLVQRGPRLMSAQAYVQALAKVAAQIEELEAAINTRSGAIRVDQQPATIAAVRAALPVDAALVEWVIYEPFNPRAHVRHDKRKPARYAACLLLEHGDPIWIDLGDAAAIEADILALRAALRRPGSDDVSTLSRALEARIMAPVRALLGNTRHVYLSPDGALNLVPFATLVDEKSHPLLERYAFTYLTSGRDLLRFSAHLPAEQGSLILANPDFDAGGTTPGAGRFPPLLHAEEEAAAASRVFPGAPAPVLRFDQATKATLLKAHGPRLLHIGTHGFFEPIACSTQADSSALTNPLLQSGIALAGANACASGHDEGILTAFEAAGLDLYGTKLAVLSACQTGVGDAKAGDGVYGLRRALVLAGAETQVMSLWPVEGAATATLMKAYYERLARGEGRSEAMRQVQLAMLHTPGREHPYYWAPFIVSGDDRTLEEKAVEPDLRVHPGGACACRVGGEVPEEQAGWVGIVAALGWMRRRTRGGGVARAAQERELIARQGGGRP